jgi:hypothetical protein
MACTSCESKGVVEMARRSLPSSSAENGHHTPQPVNLSEHTSRFQAKTCAVGCLGGWEFTGRPHGQLPVSLDSWPRKCACSHAEKPTRRSRDEGYCLWPVRQRGKHPEMLPATLICRASS